MKIRSFLLLRDSKLSTEKGVLTKSLSHNIFPEHGNKEGPPTNEISAIIRSDMEIGKIMWNQYKQLVLLQSQALRIEFEL